MPEKSRVLASGVLAIEASRVGAGQGIPLDHPAPPFQRNPRLNGWDDSTPRKQAVAMEGSLSGADQWLKRALDEGARELPLPLLEPVAPDDLRF